MVLPGGFAAVCADSCRTPPGATCIPIRYAQRMPQLVTRIDDDLVAMIDRLVAEGVVRSRSEAVRRGLQLLGEHHRRAAAGDAIVRGYTDHAQTEAEVGWADEATVRMISDEAW